jgi:hypothetical protein
VSSRHRSLGIPRLLGRLVSLPVSFSSSSPSDSDSDEEEKSALNRLLHASRIGALDAILAGGSGTHGCCCSFEVEFGREEVMMLMTEGGGLEDGVRPEAPLAGEVGCLGEYVCA